MPTPIDVAFETVIGSHLYGTNVASSDIDINTVYNEPKEMLLGLQSITDLKTKLTQEIDVEDKRRFWLRRYLALAVKCNPNIIESLYAPKDKVRYSTVLFDTLIIKNRDIFLSHDHLVHSHFGFATSQIKRMDGTNLGAKRKDISKIYGYDVKYAAHAYRLLVQLIVTLGNGTVKLPYDQCVIDQILKIRRGDLTREEFDELYKDTSADADEAIKYSKLRKDPDFDAINKIAIEYYEAKYYSD